MLETSASIFVRDRLKGVTLIDAPLDKRCRACVVIPVCREPVHRVVNLLVSLARQRGVDFGMVEVLCVVNDGPDDGSKRWKSTEQANQLVLSLPVWKNRDRFDGHLRFPLEVLEACSEVRSSLIANVVELRTSGGGMVGEALNRGLAEATVRFDRANKNGIIIFFGADNIVDDPDYLAKAMRFFEKHSELVAVSGGIRLLFDPDARDEVERLTIAGIMERFFLRKKMRILERFIQGQDLGLMPRDAFFGSHILARSGDAASWGGFPDWKRNEDSAFGIAAKAYAIKNGKIVLNEKETLLITSALRDSDRTDASLRSLLEQEMDKDPVSFEAYEACERLVAGTKEGRELIDFIEEPANILWDHYTN